MKRKMDAEKIDEIVITGAGVIVFLGLVLYIVGFAVKLGGW